MRGLHALSTCSSSHRSSSRKRTGCPSCRHCKRLHPRRCGSRSCKNNRFPTVQYSACGDTPGKQNKIFMRCNERFFIFRVWGIGHRVRSSPHAQPQCMHNDIRARECGSGIAPTLGWREGNDLFGGNTTGHEGETAWTHGSLDWLEQHAINPHLPLELE
jgi:hypothetical protein